MLAYERKTESLEDFFFFLNLNLEEWGMESGESHDEKACNFLYTFFIIYESNVMEKSH